MTRNLGSGDRIARVAVGLILLTGLFILDGDARWLGLIGLVPLATAAMGYCPAYMLLGINTDDSQSASHA
jgi:hypothetical protein